MSVFRVVIGVCGGIRVSLAGGNFPRPDCLLRAGVLGHSLSALGHGVLGQLAGQQQPDGGLDLAGGNGGALVVMCQPGRLGRDPLEDVVDEAVHDAHRLRRDAGVRVDLLQHLVDVDGVAFLARLPLLLLVRLRDVLLRLARLLRSLATGFRCHYCSLVVTLILNTLFSLSNSLALAVFSYVAGMVSLTTSLSAIQFANK
uniref:Uncharacterized protein n=1 Tax=Anopheles atroparvus TaxID=41427 RepID=A0AAG5DIR6_ANOAO